MAVQRRNFQKESKLVNDWQYMKPLGPHVDEPKKNIEEMNEEDVRALLKAGDAMAEYISSL